MANPWTFLREAALKASKGRWCAVGSWIENEREDVRDICDCSFGGEDYSDEATADARYIELAQPRNVLTLIGERNRLARRVAALERELVKSARR